MADASKKSNSQVAKDGNKAEFDFCTNTSIRHFLQRYFGKEIRGMKKIGGQKKSDILLTFADTSTLNLQLKSGTGGGRGWSCDRRALGNLPLDELGATLVGNICLKKGTERVAAATPSDLIRTLLLGTEEQYKPTHFVHIDVNKETGQLKELTICSADAVVAALQKEAYPSLVPKKTCVHLSPRLYLQRKGGGVKDHSPDDIQLKLKSFPDEIMINLLLIE